MNYMNNMFRPPRPEDRKISLGDRIFVRLTAMTGDTLEFTVSTVCGMSELIGEIRRRARHITGLAKIWIRNLSWGWATERPLRLYGSEWNPSAAPMSGRRHSLASVAVPRVNRLGPWDTH